jgi:3-methyladenine DNA glycosylase AlkC
MKIVHVLQVVLLSLGNLAATQDQTKIPAGIPMAFRAGNAAELARYMNSTIELLLLDKEDFYKKNVAEVILNDFFKEYPARDFSISHQGAKNDAQYAIGNLKTEKGDFRVYFLLKKVDNELLIHLIRIESDNGK